MQILLSLLIVAAATGEPQPRRHPDAEQVFHCTWDESSDKDFDHWPEGWVRQRGPNLPGFLPIRLANDATARSGRCLKVELNGGGATIYSPPIEVSSRFSYVLEGRLKTSGLKHDRALLSITFFDAQRQPLGTVYSEKTHDAVDWVTLRVGPLDPDPQQAETAVIGLHVQPGEREDLRASVMFDDIWLGRLPRMKLSSNSPSNVYTDPKDVTITCALSGIVGRDPEIRFQLLDATTGKRIGDGAPAGETVVAEKSAKASELLKEAPRSQAGYEGVATWKPPVEEFGFYRVRVAMLSATGIMHERQLTLAIIRPLERPRKGEFGWSLPEGDRPLSLEALTGLLPQVGINWLKFPVWYGEKEENRGDRLMRFAERLESEGIEMVGMLHSPPENVREHFGDFESMTAANIFSADSSLWLSTLDPVMTRLSLKIRWWQLGHDHDTSFVGYPDLPKKISDIRKQLYRFGQEVHMGFGWRWTVELPKSSGAPWDFLTFSADPPLTGSEMETYLDATQPLAAAATPTNAAPAPGAAAAASDAAKSHRVQRWALVEPLPASQYDVETRARDLVDQMMSAKIHNADTIIMPQPIGAEHGVMNDDGTPAELLLPWRTTAMLLGGSRYLGSIRMPQNSSNRIFTRNGETVMVVWSGHPVQEVLYLGEDIRQLDIWGRMVKPERREHEQVIEVGPVPTFILGASEPIAKWRMAVKFNQERMPSVFGKPHVNGLSLRNFFPQGAGGEIELVTPKEWKVYPQKMTYKLAVNETLVKPFEITLPFDANSGPQPVRLDFNVHVDRHYKFSVYRDLEIGLGDVLVELATRLDEHGTLIVEQRMTNNSDQVVDFKCLLYAPQRRRQSNQVFRLGRGQDLKVYRFPDGRELVGQQLWLRAEEIEGQRILNYRSIVQE